LAAVAGIIFPDFLLSGELLSLLNRRA